MANSRGRIVESRIRSVLFWCLVWVGVACDSNAPPHSAAGTGGAGTGGAVTATGGNGAGTGGITATGGAGTGGVAGGAGGNAANTGGAGSGGTASGVRACGTGDVRQELSFRVEEPAGVPALEVPALASFASVTKEINGTVSAVTRVQEPCSGCAGGSTPAVRIAVTESGQRWAVVVTPGSASDAFETAAITLANTQVKLLIRLRAGFYTVPSRAFTVRATNGDLLMAVEAGPFARTLDAVDLAPLTITNGADVCKWPTGCAPVLWIYTQLQFTFSGGPSAVVGLGANADLTFAQRRYTARNDGGGYYDPNTIRNCSDPEKTPTWAIWSEAAP